MRADQPRTVEVPDDRMPDLPAFAFGALTEAMSMSLYWKDVPRMLAGEIAGVISDYPQDGQIWVWNSNGAGDFTRISSSWFGTRWLVGFDHESDRSPWGREPEELAPGVADWISDYTLRHLRASDRLLTPDGPMSATEIYQRRRDVRADRFFWQTSPQTAELRQDLTVREGMVDSDPERQQFAELRVRLIDGERPSFAELAKLIGHELPAAAALIVIDRIDQWLEEPDM